LRHPASSHTGATGTEDREICGRGALRRDPRADSRERSPTRESLSAGAPKTTARTSRIANHRLTGRQARKATDPGNPIAAIRLPCSPISHHRRTLRRQPPQRLVAGWKSPAEDRVYAAFAPRWKPRPALLPTRWLVLPLEKMPKQDLQSADQLPAIATPHAFQLLGQVLDVDVLETTLPEPLRCPLRPGMDIVLVTTGRAHPVDTKVSA